MRLNDPEEIVPLLDQSRRNENNDGHPVYHFSKGKTRAFLKQVLDDNANNAEPKNRNYEGYDNITIANCEPQVSTSQSSNRQLFRRNRILYTWNNLNVYVRTPKKKSSWKNIFKRNSQSYFFEQQKHVLKNVYGAALPGELLAIMGPSGAGKTTLLNALTFHCGSGNIIKGSRYLNGRYVHNREVVNNISAYVEQERIFIAALTVKEHLIFQALVRLDRVLSYRQKLKRVEDVIAELGLEKCQNTIIGCPGRMKGISGGEMKRLSFASEVLTNPSIMFCDEPTSGLDSFIALNVINVLKSMAFRGKTVICTIHQPSSEIFSLFDKILLLAEGKTAFLGKPQDAVSFFSELGASPLANYNPADFYIQMLSVVPGKEESCRETIRLITSAFDQSTYGLEVASEIERGVQSEVSEEWMDEFSVETSSYRAPWFLQFRALFWRSLLNIIKEPLLVKVRLFQTVVLSLVVGLIYHNQKLNEDGVMNINGVLFTFLTNMTFQNLFAVISIFSGELPVFLKENANRMYRTDAYFLAKTLAEIPMFFAIPIIFISITYFWINLNATPVHFGIAVGILVLVTNVATSFGYFISCISSNVVMALSIGSPVVIPFLLFGGYLLNSGVIPKYFIWLSYFSWFKYGNEALLINQWADIENIECNISNSTCPRNGKVILEIYNFKEGNLWWDFLWLFVLIIFFRLLAFLALLFKTWKNQK